MASEENSFAVGSEVKIGGPVNYGPAFVRFCGTTAFAPGVWVGLELNNPAGKNDGSVKGQKYFDCPPNFGLFVRPSQLTLIAAPGGAPAAAVASPAATPAASPAVKPAASSATPAKPAAASSIPKPAATPAKPEAKSAESKPAATAAPASKLPTAPTSAAPSPTIPPAAKPQEAAASPQPVPAQPAAPAAEPAPTPEPTPAPAPVAPTVAGSAELQKMLDELNELNQWKAKTLETIKGAQKQISVLQVKNDDLTQELEREKKAKEFEKEKLQKEFEKEKLKMKKDFEKATEDLQNEVSELGDKLEMVTLDQQIAEEKAEELEKECEKLKAQIELNVTSPALPSSSSSSGQSETEKQALLQVDRLKDALMKLKDISLVEKQKSEKSILELERKAQIIPDLEDTVKHMEQEIEDKEKEIEQLKEQLEEALESQSMIETLTEKNLNLDETIAQLKSTIQELEEMKEMSEELEDQQQVVERKLKTQLYAKEIEIMDLKTKASNADKSKQELDKAVEQYKFKVRNLERKVSEYVQKDQQQTSQANELTTQSQALMEANLQLKSKALKTLSREVEDDIRKLELANSQNYLLFLKTMIPLEEMFRSDRDAMETILTSNRVTSKAFLIISQIKSYYKLDEKEELRQNYSEEELIFSWKMIQTLYRLILTSRRIEELMKKSPVDVFTKLGSLNADLSPIENRLNRILKLISRDELNESYALAELISLIEVVEKGIKDKVKEEEDDKPQDGSNFGKNYEQTIALISSSLNIFLLRLLALHKKVPIAGREGIIQQAKEVLDTCKLMQSKVKDKAFKESDALVSQLSNINQIISDLLALTSLISDNYAKRMKDENVEKLTPEQLVKIFQEVLSDSFKSDNFLSNEPASQSNPQSQFVDHVLSNMLTLQKYLEESKEQLLFASVDPVSSTTEEKASLNESWRVRANDIKNMILTAPTFKAKLEKSNQNELELLKTIKIKEQELLESSRKESLFERRIDQMQKKDDDNNQLYQQTLQKHTQQTKMYEDALESLRQEIQQLEVENSSVKTLLVKAESSPRPSNSTEKSSSQSVPLELVNAEVGRLKVVVKHLKKENARLKSDSRHNPEINASVSLLSSPLPSSAAIAVPSRVKQYKSELETLFKESQNLLASVKVVDLKANNAEEVWKKERDQAQSNLSAIKVKSASLKHKINQTTSKDSTLIVTSEKKIPIGRIEVPFSNYDKDVYQNYQLFSAAPASASASSPAPDNNITPIILFNPHQFKAIHSLLVK